MVIAAVAVPEFGQFLLEENENLKQAALLQPQPGSLDSADGVDRRGVEDLIHKYRYGAAWHDTARLGAVMPLYPACGFVP